MEIEQQLTLTDLAPILGVNRDFLLRLCRAKKIDHIKTPGGYRTSEKAWLKYTDKYKVEADNK